jgi:NodT family efflux transporter outer membrane factor (OMF) lipoprotein
MPIRPASAFLVALSLTGCTLGQNFKPPENPVTQAKFDTHAAPGATATPVADAWWTLFGDAELTKLEGRVVSANLDVRVAALHLAEARTQSAIAGAAALPVVNGNVNVTREAQSQRGVLALLGGSGSQAGSANGAGGTTGGIPASSPSSPLANPFNLYQLGFDASWEIDLWGRVKRSVESAEASALISQEAARGVLITAQAELARDYMLLRGTQADIALVNRNLAEDGQTLGLVRDRFNNGLATALDVTNQESQRADTQALLPALQQQQAQAVNAIAYLLGEAPGTLSAELLSQPGQSPTQSPIPPEVPVGLPSELTRRRPDIRQAEAQLHVATANIGVAVADFYPRFTLSASAALQALQPHYLDEWSARTFGIGPGITLPIFNGGLLKRRLELRETEQQEAVLLYQHSVLTALHDVDNALIAYASEQDRQARLIQALQQTHKALDLAQARYSGGVGDFLSVLDAERRTLAGEQAIADSRTRILTNLVQLYKALGGGWGDAGGLE